MEFRRARIADRPTAMTVCGLGHRDAFTARAADAFQRPEVYPGCRIGVSARGAGGHDRHGALESAPACASGGWQAAWPGLHDAARLARFLHRQFQTMRLADNGVAGQPTDMLGDFAGAVVAPHFLKHLDFLLGLVIG